MRHFGSGCERCDASIGRQRLVRAARALTTSLLLLSGVGTTARLASAQTLARPGWAGSGMTVAQWWRNAVMVEVAPGSSAIEPVLSRTRAQLGDLQTLGADALLLRGIDSGAASPSAYGEPQLSAGYGSLDDFDQLMREASGRRLRLLVELPSSLAGEALLADARFWLNRGASGVYLAGPAGADSGTTHALRGVLRSYIGSRVLIGDAAPDIAEPTSTAAGPGKGANSPTGAPDMRLSSLRGFGAESKSSDAAAVRSSLERARRSAEGAGVAEIDPAAPEVSGEEAKARAAALLIVRGSVALRAQDVGVGPEERAKREEAEHEAAEERAIATATSPAAASNARRAAAARKSAPPAATNLPGDTTFAWYQRMIGLHRGNAVLLRGEQTILNHDGEGALMAVWQGRSGQPLVALINLRKDPLKLSLTDDLSKLRLRGVFLRTVLRSDAGIGAMSLREASLPGYGVYLGQLGR